MGYFRSRRFLPATVAALIAIVLVLLTENSTVRVVVDPDPVRLRLALLSPLALVVAAVPTLVLPFGESELRFSRKLMWLRACHLLWFVVLIALLWLAIQAAWEDQALGDQVIRNTVLLLGLLLLASGATHDLAWLPAMLLVAITYARGVNYDLGRPRRWALLLKPPDEVSVAVSIAALAAGALVFLVAEYAKPIRRRTA